MARPLETWQVRWLDPETGEMESTVCVGKTYARAWANFVSSLGAARIQWRRNPEEQGGTVVWSKAETPWRDEVGEPRWRDGRGPGHDTLVRDPSFSSYVEMIERFPAAYEDAFQALAWCRGDLGSDVHDLMTGTILDCGGGRKGISTSCEECGSGMDPYGRCFYCGTVGSAPIGAHGNNALVDEHLWIAPYGPTMRFTERDLGVNGPTFGGMIPHLW